MKELTGLIPQSQITVMKPDLDRTAGQEPNQGIINRTVELVAQEHMVHTTSFVENRAEITIISEQ